MLNGATESMFGYSREELVGNNISMLMRPEDQLRHKVGFSNFMNVGNESISPDKAVRGTALSKSGELIPISMTVSIVQGINTRQAVGSIRDLRPQQDHERVVEFLEVTFNAIDQGITIYDDDLKLVSWNPRYESLNVAPEFRFSGARLSDLYEHCAKEGMFGEGDPQALAQARLEATKNGPLIQSELLHLDDKIVRIERVKLNNGGVCATFRDITEELKLEETLRHSRKMEAVGELAGGIAHDFNNILMVVLASAEMLSTQVNSPAARGLLQSILAAAQNGGAITHRLLAFSRKQPLLPRPLDPNAIVASVTTMLARLLGENIAVSARVSADTWHCHVDPSQLEAGLMNLAINARDAMPNGGQLTLSVSNKILTSSEALILDAQPGEYVCFEVADTGCGMTPAVLEQAFDPFFTTKSAERGTGMGLSMIYGFVKQSQGAIHIASNEDGTRVLVYLPRSSAISQPLASNLTESPIPRGKKILVVEDEVSIRSVLVNYLTGLGLQCIDHADGDSALDALDQYDMIDYLVTDIVLPGNADGWSVASVAQEKYPNIRCIYVSGYFRESLRSEEKLVEGAFLTKPFSLTDLRKLLFEEMDVRSV